MNSRAGVNLAEVREIPQFEDSGRELFFSSGLLGFGACRHYKLQRFKTGDGSDSPFFMLQAVDQDLMFPLIHPASINLDYRYPITPELLTTLAATSAEELVPLLIVTVRERIEEITVNLKGPIILNQTKGLGLQLVIEQYELHHPLLPRGIS
jgi:flagellar assembly factor FliW